jgi:predicted SAM-dependent methyltransferase
MKLLNVGCGGQRPQDEIWWNLDNLRTQLHPGTPERTNLDKEPRYVECDLNRKPIPFLPDFFDGIVLIHVIEHFCCHDAVNVLTECRRVLKPGGLLVVSVPDAEYFLRFYDEDTKDRAEALFGEPIHDPGFEKFFDYALFRHDHKQILTRDSLLCLVLKSGFSLESFNNTIDHPAFEETNKVMNRKNFSLEIRAIK